MAEKINKTLKLVLFSPSSHSFFYPNSKISHGGAELQMFLLAKQLSKSTNFEISFFVANEGQKKIEILKNIKLIRSINLLKFDNLFSKINKTIILFFILRKQRPNIIISTTASSLTGIISFFSKTLRIKHIFRVASNLDTDKSEIKKNGALGKVYKYGLENANTVLCQNIEQEKNLKKYHNISAVRIKNVFEIKSIKKVLKKNILWVGRFVDVKKPNLFIELASKIKDEQFTMICPYNKKDKIAWDLLKQTADKLSNITLIEKVPFNEIQEYFNKAKLFVNTSDAEGFPNTFLQAAQANTPIVSLNVNPDSFITKNNCGIYCNGSIEKMVSDTHKLLQNKEDLEIKGENCFNYLKENHDIKVVTKQLENIIQSM